MTKVEIYRIDTIYSAIYSVCVYIFIYIRIKKWLSYVCPKLSRLLRKKQCHVLGFHHETLKRSELTSIVSIIQFRDAFDLAVLD